ANRLAMSKACHLYVNDVFPSESWIDPLQAANSIVAKFVVRPGKLRICYRHVIRNVYDRVVSNPSQVRKFDDTGNFNPILRNVDPEMGAHWPLQFQDDTNHANAVNRLIARFQIGG